MSSGKWVSLFAWGSVALGLLAGLYACGAIDHSDEPGLITVNVDSSATRFSRLTVVLQDTTGERDTLFNGPLLDPSQLRRLPTKDYHGGRTTVIITGYQDDVQVYQEKRAFDASASTAPKRDTVQDVSVALTGIQWSTEELVIPIGDTSRLLVVTVTPKQGDDRAMVKVLDPSVLELRAYGRNADGVLYRILTRSPGSSLVIVQSSVDPRWTDTVSILVSQTVLKPQNLSPEWSASSRPTWKWTTGGKGVGIYRCRIDNDTLAGARLLNDSVFQSPDPLPHGPHTLYLQERDADGNWSLKAALTIKVDLIPPEPPAVENAGLDQTQERTPGWTWKGGGEGNGTFRYLLDGEDLNAQSTTTTALKFTATSDLSPGPHVFRVQERDSAGNWSASGSAEVTIILSDVTPPNPPAFYPRKANSGGFLAADSITWHSGGGAGSGYYRYQVDNNDFRLNTSTGSRDSAFAPPPDSIPTHNVLYVQERDSVGNWSLAGRYEFNAVRFSFLQAKVHSGIYVITVDPDAAGEGDRIHLARRVTQPKNDSELTLLHRQLWVTVRNTNVEADFAYAIYNPFYNKVLRTTGAGTPVILGYRENIKLDSAYLWDIPLLLPPPPPGSYSILRATRYPGQNLNIQGDAPWTEANNLILWEYSGGEDNEMWRFLPYEGARFIE